MGSAERGGDTVSYRNASHLKRSGKVLWPIVDSGQEVAVEVDHLSISPTQEKIPQSRTLGGPLLSESNVKGEIIQFS